MTTKPSKTWEITVNNPTESDIATLHRIKDEVSRILISEEWGEKKRTRHLQGRITFKRAYRLAALKKVMPRAHWQETKATADWIYAQKEGSNVIIDQKNEKQGHRTDLDEIIEDIKNGMTEQQLWIQHPKTMIRYSKGVLELRKKLQPEGTRAKFQLSDFPWTPITNWQTSHVILGKAGIGKTEFAKAHFKNALMVSHIDDLLKFIPDEHDGIIFDDMKFKHLPRSTQIHLVDIDNSRSIHCRYNTATIPANTKKIFTTNEEDIFAEDEAISRRVTVTEVTER